MGTKGGKPISTIEKKQKKVERKEAKEERKEVKLGVVEQSMINKVLEDLKSQTHLTTFQVAQKYGVRYSVAKKLVRAVVSQGDAEIAAKNRRTIAILPRKQ